MGYKSVTTSPAAVNGDGVASLAGRVKEVSGVLAILLALAELGEGSTLKCRGEESAKRTSYSVGLGCLAHACDIGCYLELVKFVVEDGPLAQAGDEVLGPAGNHGSNRD